MYVVMGEKTMAQGTMHNPVSKMVTVESLEVKAAHRLLGFG